MVVLGVDAHKRIHTLVAVDPVGRKLGEKVVLATSDGHAKGLQLREHLPDLLGRFGGVAMRAAAGFAQRVRGDPGPRRRALPDEPLRRLGMQNHPDIIDCRPTLRLPAT
jgi:hypothetical protein